MYRKYVLGKITIFGGIIKMPTQKINAILFFGYDHPLALITELDLHGFGATKYCN